MTPRKDARYVMPLSMEGQQFGPHEKVAATAVDDYEPERGDVVVFEDPGGWLAGDISDGKLIKRVIGVAGDTIECCDEAGRLLVDGEALDESAYLAKEHGRCAAELPSMAVDRDADRMGPCRWKLGPVPADAMFVLGDNRSFSADSRFHVCGEGGPVCEPWIETSAVVAVVE